MAREMAVIFFEDLDEGVSADFGHYDVTKAEVIAFASEFDPQPFHLDERAAEKSMLKKLSASGWHTAAMGMRMLYDAYIKDVASMGGTGIEELKWMKPVYVGDRLGGRRTIIDKRVSKSRPEMGLVRMRVEILNQDGTVVMSHVGVYIVACRHAAPAPAGAPRTADAVAPMPQPVSSETAPMTQFFDDLTIGAHTSLGTETFTAENIIRFAKAYDPQAFHVDAVAAAKSHFGSLVASGWHTGACFMKHIVRRRDELLTAFVAKGGTAPEPGPSPGLRDLRWPRPVLAGDTVRYGTTIVDKRKTSRPGWGLVFARNTGINQHDALVFEYQSAVFWQIKP